MSWILKHKKKATVFILVLIIMIVFAAIYINLHLNPFILAFVYLVLFFGFCFNEAVTAKMWKQQEPFWTFSQIRNVDYLIIGDKCMPSEFVPSGKTYVQISAPGRNLNSAYQILRHTHSILKEDGGTVILPCGNSKRDFMIFDIPFLHPITIKKYHLEGLRMRSKLPVIFAPIDSVRFLLGRGTKHIYKTMQQVDTELNKFCEERNYSLYCYDRQ